MKRLWLLLLLIPFPLLLLLRGGSDNGDLSGERIFANHCAACHQADGTGVAGSYPPLAGHVPVFLGHEGGREHLINTLLYGLRGEIEVLGGRYSGTKPPWHTRLTDDEIASALNHTLTAWGNDALLSDFVPIASDEVAALRQTPLTQDEVHERRQTLLPGGE
jgi:mono/diheme cytochrome c family protein